MMRTTLAACVVAAVAGGLGAAQTAVVSDDFVGTGAGLPSGWTLTAGTEAGVDDSDPTKVTLLAGGGASIRGDATFDGTIPFQWVTKIDSFNNVWSPSYGFSIWVRSSTTNAYAFFSFGSKYGYTFHGVHCADGTNYSVTMGAGYGGWYWPASANVHFEMDTTGYHFYTSDDGINLDNTYKDYAAAGWANWSLDQLGPHAYVELGSFGGINAVYDRVTVWQDVAPPPPAAHPGDANGDGVVDLQDFGALKDHFGALTGATWDTGDFNADGATDLQDFGILKDHFGHTSGDTPVTAVPEPATLALLAAAAAAGVSRRRR